MAHGYNDREFSTYFNFRALACKTLDKLWAVFLVLIIFAEGCRGNSHIA